MMCDWFAGREEGGGMGEGGGREGGREGGKEGERKERVTGLVGG